MEIAADAPTPSQIGQCACFLREPVQRNPAITAPFGELPARLPSREAFTALGIPTSFKSLEELQAVTSVVVFSACGEQFEGMSQDWHDEVCRMTQEASQA